MIYKFRSKATSELIMLGGNGDEMLRLIGKEPSAKGILEPAQMAQALLALQAAVQHSEQPGQARGISLRQRLWPMVEMIKRAQGADQPIVWGV